METQEVSPSELIVSPDFKFNLPILDAFFTIHSQGLYQNLPPAIAVRHNYPDRVIDALGSALRKRYEYDFSLSKLFDLPENYLPDPETILTTGDLADLAVTHKRNNSFGGIMYSAFGKQILIAHSIVLETAQSSPFYLLNNEPLAISASLAKAPVIINILENDSDISDARRMSQRGAAQGFNSPNNSLSDLVCSFEHNLVNSLLDPFKRNRKCKTIQDVAEELMESGKLPEYMFLEAFHPKKIKA